MGPATDLATGHFILRIGYAHLANLEVRDRFGSLGNDDDAARASLLRTYVLDGEPPPGGGRPPRSRFEVAKPERS